MNEKLTVGIFIDGDFIPSYSGAKNRMHYLSRYLQRVGVRVIIFHCYRGWSNLRLISREPFKTYIFPISCYYNNLDFLAAFIRREKIKIIQFCDLESIVSQGIKLSEKTGAYLVVELHYVVSSLAKNLGATRERIQTIRRLETVSGMASDHIISLTNIDSLELQKKMCVTSDRISAIPSGVNLEEVKYRGPNLKARTLLFLGNLYFEPNVEAVKLIHKYVFPKLNQYGFKFIFVGDCPPTLKRRFQARNFTFIGPVKDLDKIFRKATVALAPVMESTGLRIKILNYLAAGLPVIATSSAVCGISETKNIIIENDIKKYAQIIYEIINHPNYFSRLTSDGRKFIEHHFGWRKIALQTALVYKKILSRPIKDKKLLYSKVKNLQIGKPDWLDEFERKRRFRRLRSKILGKYSYGIIHHKKIRIFRK